MNRNDLKDTNPVYISKSMIEEYKEHYRELIIKSWSPGGFSYMGGACEAENVLTKLFRVPQSEIQDIMTQAMKETCNECKTDNRSMPDA